MTPQHNDSRAKPEGSLRRMLLAWHGSQPAEQPAHAEQANQKGRPVLWVGGLLLGIIVLVAHAAGGFVLFTTGLRGFSWNNPLLLILLGLMILVATLKIVHVVGRLHGKWQHNQVAGNHDE